MLGDYSSLLLPLLALILSLAAGYFLANKVRDGIPIERKWKRFLSPLFTLVIIFPASLAAMIFILASSSLLDFGR